MSHLDPYGSREPRGWERQDEPRGWERQDEPRGWPEPSGGQPGPRDGEDPRAWRHGAAPEAYAQPSGHGPADGYGNDDLARGNHDAGPGDPRFDTGVERIQRPDADRSRYPGGRSIGPDPSAYGPGPSVYGPAGPPVAAEHGAGQPSAAPERPPGRRARGRRRAGARRTAGQAAPTGRAGRNLPAAIGVGLSLAVAVLAPLFFFRPAFFGVVALAAGIGSWEMARAVRARGVHPPVVPLIAGGVLMTGMAWRAGPDALSLGLLVTVLATMIWRLGDGPAGYQRDLPAAVLIAVYVPFLAGFAALLAVPPDGDLRVLVTLAAVVLSDTGGYATGVLLGRHPMAPSVSPKKSWEGFSGSVVAAAAGSAALLFVLFDVAPAWGALFGLAVSISAVLGDLGESMLKRDLGIKDMSRLLPGHGGLMDRLDSILFAVPTAYLLLSILAPTG